mgnify:CR=1 FL=1
MSYLWFSGKLRARKLNNVQPNLVEVVEYPLIFKAAGKAPYFQKREEWRITDVLKNPMVCARPVDEQLWSCFGPKSHFTLDNTLIMKSPLEHRSLAVDKIGVQCCFLVIAWALLSLLRHVFNEIMLLLWI